MRLTFLIAIPLLVLGIVFWMGLNPSSLVKPAVDGAPSYANEAMALSLCHVFDGSGENTQDVTSSVKKLLRANVLKEFAVQQASSIPEIAETECGLLLDHNNNPAVVVGVVKRDETAFFQIVQPSGHSVLKAAETLADVGYKRLLVFQKEPSQLLDLGKETEGTVEAPIWINFGVFSASTPREYTRSIQLTNHTPGTVVVERTIVSCGCLKVDSKGSREIPSGCVEQFDIHYTSGSKTSLWYSVVFVLRTADGVGTQFKLPLFGNNVATAKVSPTSLDLGSERLDITSNSIISTEVRISETHFDRFKVAGAETDIDGLGLSCRVEERPFDTGLSDFVMYLELDYKGLKPGQHHGHLLIDTANREYGSPAIPISLEVLAEIEIHPPQHCYGPLKPGDSASRKFGVVTAIEFDDVKLVGDGADDFGILWDGSQLEITTTAKQAGLAESDLTLQFYKNEEFLVETGIVLSTFVVN